MFTHTCPFDPTYGYSLSTLQSISAPPPPGDFEMFWRDTYEQTLAVPLDLVTRRIQIPELKNRGEAFEVEYQSFGPHRTTAWLTVPNIRPLARGVVWSHGYGERGGPDLDWYGPPAVQIFPCARGLGRSNWPGGPRDVPAHVTHGIASRETYIHRLNITELWSAASVLLHLFPDIAGHLDYAGGSFGGGIGAMVIPWEKRFRRAYIDMPSFGHHPIRLECTCQGSGEAVRLHYQRHPEIAETLRYYDSATHSLFTTTPTLVAPALFDPAVPPPGQFAVANALACEKKVFIRQAAHFDWPGATAEHENLCRELNAWFS